MREISPLQKERLNYQPKLAGALANGINAVKLALGEATTSVADKEDIKNPEIPNTNYEIVSSYIVYIFVSFICVVAMIMFLRRKSYKYN